MILANLQVLKSRLFVPRSDTTIYLINAAELVIELNARGVKIGVASSVRKHEWQAAEIYPNKRSMVYRLSDEQMAKILAFGSDWSENVN